MSHERSFGEITCHILEDTAKFAYEFTLAASNLRSKDGVLVDMRALTPDEIADGTGARAIIAALGERDDPLMLLLSRKLERGSTLGKFVEGKYWWRIEASGDKAKAENKLNKLMLHHEREARDRMERLFHDQ